MAPRLKAFLFHLSASAVIALAVLWVVFLLWYPEPLHVAVGVTHIFLILLLIDVVLGPTLTLIVYKPKKKSLIFDMSVILLLQVSALGYGLLTVAEGRPVWLVFNIDRFDLVRDLDIDSRSIEDAEMQYRTPPWFGPAWVAAMEPADAETRSAIMLEAFSGGPDLPQRPNLYHPLNVQSAEIRERTRSLDMLEAFNDAERVSQILAQWPDADGWLPMNSSAQSMVVLMRSDTAEVVAVVDLRPWL